MKPIQYTITAVDRATAVVDKISNRMERLTQPFSRLERSVKRFGDVSGVNRLSKGVVDLTSKMTSLLGIVLKIGTPLLAIFGGGSIAGIYNMTENWARLGSTVSNTSQIMGVSTQKLMNWRGVGDLVGISAENMTRGLQGFQQTLQDAKFGRNQPVFGMLQMLGIKLKTTKNGVVDTEAVMMQLADRIQKIQKKDPAAAQKLADMMGVSELMPVLMNGSKSIKAYQAEVKRLQGNITPEMTDRAKGFALSLNKMKVAADGTKGTIADKLIPVFQPLIDKFSKWLSLNREDISDKIAQLAERIAKWLDKIDFDATLNGINKFLEGSVNIAKWIDKVVDKFGGWENVIKGVGVLIGVSFVTNIGLGVASLIGLVSQLTLATGAMTALRLAGLGLTGVGLAGLGGWVIGTGIRNAYMGTEKGQQFDNWLGDKIARGMQYLPDWAGGKTARDAVAINDRMTTNSSKFVAPSGKELIQSKLLFESLEGKFGLSKGLLDRQWFAESRRGKNMLSPVGASGHFQFMPGTASRFGLSRSDTYDLNKSAVAAAKYMSWLKKRYKGNERLAAMAYNWGEGNVDSFLKYGHGIKTKRNPTGVVPQETKGYIEKVTGGANNIGVSGQQNPINVSVNTTVHPNGKTMTKVETPQGIKISHNQPGEGYGSIS
ncbi:transglycosylase SLT domain-containing protein [Acinetobacter guerrae]|uniref:transglycosylase SLT domain-containing protein n=1 Tax=Acinetobacter guerrae TaxID=1843371 RepID=UPI00128C1985|nr:transglycosylase SLT domain-containing protein [Acinetobacter guerrae]MPW44740.1 hypothetical protein [Acinetobacter guerrae]